MGGKYNEEDYDQPVSRDSLCHPFCVLRRSRIQVALRDCSRPCGRKAVNTIKRRYRSWPDIDLLFFIFIYFIFILKL
nr:MAG TPA: hypothetical protein [Caudoviricetes sp.]